MEIRFHSIKTAGAIPHLQNNTPKAAVRNRLVLKLTLVVTLNLGTFAVRKRHFVPVCRRQTAWMKGLKNEILRYAQNDKS